MVYQRLKITLANSGLVRLTEQSCALLPHTKATFSKGGAMPTSEFDELSAEIGRDIIARASYRDAEFAVLALSSAPSGQQAD
jgi:hypothetical protein